MRNPEQSKESKKAFIPLIPANLSKYVTEFYEKLHAFDIKYTSVIYTTVQKYTLLAITSKVIQKILDGPALLLFLFFYFLWGNPSPLSFTAYIIFWVLYHEFGIKRYFHRNRPTTASGQNGFSFPSSHAFTSGLVIASCLYFALPYEPFLITLAVINIVNRLAIGVHYIADVTAGTILGLIAGLAWPIILGIAKVILP